MFQRFFFFFFLFVSGIRVLEWQRAMSRKVPSSCLIWESCRLRDFIIKKKKKKSLPECKSKRVLLFFLALIILCQHMDKTVCPNQLFSHFASEPRTSIFLAQKGETTQLRK